MPKYICITCGHQYEETQEPPSKCLICEDERQYVNPEGQFCTTNNKLGQGHSNIVTSLEPGLNGVATEPKFAIWQRALLI